MTTSLKEMSLGESTYLLHHVFLPPKLPQSEDYNPEYEQSLLESVIRNLQKFSSLVPDEDSDILVSTANAMSCLRDICEHDGSIDQAKLKKSLGYLNDQGKSGNPQADLLQCILLAFRWLAPYLCP